MNAIQFSGRDWQLQLEERIEDAGAFGNTSACNKLRSKFVSETHIKHANRNYYAITKQGNVAINDTDWFLTFVDGSLFVMPDNIFKKLFIGGEMK